MQGAIVCLLSRSIINHHMGSVRLHVFKHEHYRNAAVGAVLIAAVTEGFVGY